MEILFFIIFGGLLLFFIGYGIWMFHQDKKIVNEYQNKMDGRLLGRDYLSEEEVGIQYSEQLFFGSIESYN
jgi:hypothetical protein